MASSSLLAGCLHLDLSPETIDVDAMKVYVRPTNHSKPNYDLDLTNPEDFKKINKHTCFSADDLAEIERALNKCH